MSQPYLKGVLRNIKKKKENIPLEIEIEEHKRDHRPSSDMCEACTGCGECIIGYYARTGRPLYVGVEEKDASFGRATFGSLHYNKLPTINDFLIKPKWIGGWEKKQELGREPIYEDANLDTIIGGIKTKYPVVIPGLGSTKVADKISYAIGRGAAEAGIIMTLGENIINMYGKERVFERIDQFAKYWDNEYGGLIIQANVEDWNARLQELVWDYTKDQYGKNFIDKAFGFELKGGQAAKPGMGGEVRIYDRDKAKELKGKGFILFPDPDEVKDVPMEGYERHSVPGICAPDLSGLEAKVKKLREIGYFKIFFKTGSYSEFELEATMNFVKKMKMDVITIDGKPGGTGMSPKEIMENVGIGTLHCLVIGYSVLQKMEGEKPSFLIAGGISQPGHVIKSMLLGADGVGMASSMCAAAMYLGYKGIINYVEALKISSKQILTCLKEYTPDPIKGKAKTFLIPLTKEASEITGLPLMDNQYKPNYI